MGNDFYKCIFDEQEKFCTALTSKKCEGCKFRKTEWEYIEAQQAAAVALDKKDLEPCAIRDSSGQMIMTTRKVSRWF